MIDLIPTQSGRELHEYFSSRVKRPWGILTTDLPEKGVKVVGVDISLKGLARWATKGARKYRLAWMWLRPAAPQFTLDDLHLLKEKAGLADLENSICLAAIVAECHEFERTHPRLALWIRQRISLLEFQSSPFVGVSENLEHAAQRIRQQVLGCLSMMYSNANIARRMADQIIDSALEGAAQTVCEVLGNPPHDCRATANLMIPVNSTAVDGVEFLKIDIAQKNLQTALALWGADRLSEKRLLVVAETKGAHHLGFWVPLVRSSAGEPLPGAPTAYEKFHGSFVFKGDLPGLDGFSGSLPDRWRAYIKENLDEKLFVSLPFVVRKSDTQLRRDCVAVLNVNADPPDKHDWHRAYHREWLKVAAREAAKFVEPAVEAMRIRSVIDIVQNRGTLTNELGHLSRYLQVANRLRITRVNDGDNATDNAGGLAPTDGEGPGQPKERTPEGS